MPSLWLWWMKDESAKFEKKIAIDKDLVYLL